MTCTLATLLSVASITIGLLSAACWLRASFVKVDPQSAIATRAREAKARGETPSGGSTSLDGWDMSATFRAQSKWNSLGALFAALSISCQALSQIFSGV
jgi:hypothetical protein